MMKRMEGKEREGERERQRDTHREREREREREKVERMQKTNTHAETYPHVDRQANTKRKNTPVSESSVPLRRVFVTLRRKAAAAHRGPVCVPVGFGACLEPPCVARPPLLG